MRTLISARYDCDFAPRKLTSIVVRKWLLLVQRRKTDDIFMILEYILQNIFSKSNVL